MPDLLLASVRLEHFLVLGGVLFAVGLLIALSKRNAVGVLMGIELMLNAVNITLVAFSRFIVSLSAMISFFASSHATSAYVSSAVSEPGAVAGIARLR